MSKYIRKYEYKCMTCDHIYWFEHSQSYKNCKKCKDKGELRLKSIRHDDIEEDEEPEMPEGGWECSECGAPVENMNDYCSQRCFNAGMR
jgi:DNA-directed RNA polymerase subunit RPC12/RpoP